jgi:hypothetical protein
MVESYGMGGEQVVEQLAGLHQLVRGGSLAINRQLEQSPVDVCPESESMVRELQQRLDRQAAELGSRLQALGRETDTCLPSVSAGPPERTERASQAVAGDHEFLQRLSLAYLELHSVASAHGDQETASLAYRDYEDTQAVIRDRISRVKPRVASLDQASDGASQPGVVGESADPPSEHPTAAAAAGLAGRHTR